MKRPSPEIAQDSPAIGLVQWFRPGDYHQVESVLSDARALGVRHLRTGISWADWYAREGDGWYAWLLPRLAQEVEVLPCVKHTPPSLGIVPKYSSPPAVPKTYADFIDVVVSRLGKHFQWIELWNHPNNLEEWDSRLDTNWNMFSEMIGGAAYWIRQLGKKSVLPGLWPPDPQWLSLMKERGVLEYIDAVGVQGFPGAAEFPWTSWAEELTALRERLSSLSLQPEIWITQTGYSTWRGNERAQVSALLQAVDAPVDRMYWYAAQDECPCPRARDSFRSDERDFHYGLKRADGRPKLLYEIWADSGIQGVRHAETSRPATRNTGRRKHVLITGGAGFIGTNLASRLLEAGRPVLIYDNLSRPGSQRNVAWLKQQYPKGLTVKVGDVRDSHTLRNAVRSAEEVYHLAAQVAVTSSLTDPKHDFDVNVGGTLKLLEAVRSMDTPPPVLFTSTNKVYGPLTDLALQGNGHRYQPLDTALRTGINEQRPLDFHSPYGCSKGAADQYVLDYARTFGLSTIVFRMSCIYGLHQNGTEDQGWVAHFLIQALKRQSIYIYGDGMQVRDLLFADDLVDALLLAQSNIQSLSGQAFNIGGGLGNTISLWDLLDLLEKLHGERPLVETDEWRPGDQRYYVSDTQKFKTATGWAPKVSVDQGVKRLFQWLAGTHGAVPMPRTQKTGALDAVLTH